MAEAVLRRLCLGDFTGRGDLSAFPDA